MKRLYGYAGKILRVNLTEGTSSVHPLEHSLAAEYLGGRGFNTRRLLTEVSAGADPLGPENKLFFATGPLVGTRFPTASRWNVSGKSPQTGILGDSNAGGHLAAEIKYAGYDQIILEGRSKKPVYVNVSDKEVTIRDASSLRGLSVYETDAAVKQDLGDPRVQVAAVGPAAENGVLYAGIYGNVMRAAARTGMGTVMASKGVKALAVRGTGAIEVADHRRFEELCDQFAEEIRAHPQYEGRRRMGTTRILMMAQQAGFLPTRNYQQGVYEHAEEVSGERLAREFNVKTRGCYACTIPCSRFYVVREGPHKGLAAEGPEYESQGSFTSRLGSRHLDAALAANDACNRLGIDTLSAVGAIGWAMELYQRGLLTSEEADGLDLSWGNPETILKLLDMISRREGFGDLLADGSLKAAQRLGRGEEYAMQVKGLDLIMADPRGLKGFGLGYAVASRGGDHLRSEPFLELEDTPEKGLAYYGIGEASIRRSSKGKGALVKHFEEWNAVIDALEPCKNIMQNMELLTYPRAAEVIEACTGLKMTAEQVSQAGERIINVERVFNAREGKTRIDDGLPRRFREEPLREGASSGTVWEQEPILDDYYTRRGWSLKTGNPTRETLTRLGLSREADELE